MLFYHACDTVNVVLCMYRFPFSSGAIFWGGWLTKLRSGSLASDVLPIRCLVLPCRALPCLALPCPALLCFATEYMRQLEKSYGGSRASWFLGSFTFVSLLLYVIGGLALIANLIGFCYPAVASFKVRLRWCFFVVFGLVRRD